MDIEIELELKKLRRRIRKLERCCCENRMTFHEPVDMDFFDEQGTPKPPEEINLNDRLPGDSCHGAKGVVVFRDATTYCEFWNGDGWVVISFAHGGTNF